MASSNTSVYYHAPMPAPHHFNLRMILRTANERYRVVANTFRENLQLSHHARKLAQLKGLKIDTAHAARCPQKLVSVLPLHVIDTTLSPTLNRAASEDLLGGLAPVIPAFVPVPAMRRVQPPVVPRLTIPLSISARKPAPVIPMSRTKTPDGTIKAFAPVVIRDQGNPWRGPTSRFSITPNDELFQVHGRSMQKHDLPEVPKDLTERDITEPDVEDNISESSEGSQGSGSESSSSGPSTPVSAFTFMSQTFR
jgi:hypothetical protein